MDLDKLLFPFGERRKRVFVKRLRMFYFPRGLGFDRKHQQRHRGDRVMHTAGSRPDIGQFALQKHRFEPSEQKLPADLCLLLGADCLGPIEVEKDAGESPCAIGRRTVVQEVEQQGANRFAGCRKKRLARGDQSGTKHGGGFVGGTVRFFRRAIEKSRQKGKERREVLFPCGDAAGQFGKSFLEFGPGCGIGKKRRTPKDPGCIGAQLLVVPLARVEGDQPSQRFPVVSAACRLGKRLDEAKRELSGLFVAEAADGLGDFDDSVNLFLRGPFPPDAARAFRATAEKR